jgi:predicted metalloprotease
MRVRMIGVVVGLTLVAAVACTSSDPVTTTSPTTQAQQQSSSDTKKPTGTLPVSDGEKPTESKKNKTAKPYADTVDISIQDIQDWWAETMPEVYNGKAYKDIPPTKLYPATEKKAAPSCSPEGGKGSYKEVHNNAFYCSLGGYVAWDDQDLMPRLYKTYGEFAVAMVFAHEWGHAIQDQTKVLGTVPTIVTENQADCFAGAWTKHALEDKSAGFRATANDLQSALAGMLEFRDQPGTSINDQSAHGSGFDRVNGFQTGFDEGAAKCATFIKDQPKFLNLKFGSQEDVDSGGNMDYDNATKFASLDLNAYWENIAKKYKVDFTPVDSVEKFSADTAMPKCGDKQYTEDEALGTIFFCVDDNKVAWDDDMLRDVSSSIGDFGLAVLLAKQWAASFQLQGGQSKDQITSKLGSTQQSCFTGAWTRAVLDGDEHNLTNDGKPSLTLSPGDLDEAVQAFLAFSDSPDEKGTTASGSAFENVKAFRDGFLATNGEVICDSYGSSDGDNSTSSK